MKISKKIICFILILVPVLAFAEEERTIHITIDPAVHYQIIDGFGASDAWRCQFIGKNWPMEKRERIADLLFSQEVDKKGNPKGIGLSLWRFYLISEIPGDGESVFKIRMAVMTGQNWPGNSGF
jgi:O-glycosyl hydrolase